MYIIKSKKGRSVVDFASLLGAQPQPLVLNMLHSSVALICSGRRGWPAWCHEGNNDVTEVRTENVTVHHKGQCQGHIVTEPGEQWLGAAKMEIFWRTEQMSLFSFCLCLVCSLERAQAQELIIVWDLQTIYRFNRRHLHRIGAAFATFWTWIKKPTLKEFCNFF